MKIIKIFAPLCLVCGGAFVLNAYFPFMTASPIVPGLIFLGMCLALFYANRTNHIPVDLVAEEDLSKEQAEKKAKDKAEREQTNLYAYTGILAEFAFVILPLIVIAMIGAISGWNWRIIAGSPEFSFGTAILIGQTIIRIVSFTAKGSVAHAFPIIFIVSFLIVVGLVPSLIIMSSILTREHPSLGLIIAQICLFLVASVAFFSFGLIVYTNEINDQRQNQTVLQELKRRATERKIIGEASEVKSNQLSR